jgi:hypothetical protein
MSLPATRHGVQSFNGVLAWSRSGYCPRLCRSFLPIMRRRETVKASMACSKSQFGGNEQVGNVEVSLIEMLVTPHPTSMPHYNLLALSAGARRQSSACALAPKGWMVARDSQAAYQAVEFDLLPHQWDEWQPSTQATAKSACSWDGDTL